MTAAEKNIALALQQVTFLPGSYDKRFCHQLPNWYELDMTTKGRAMMLEMFEKYRRQIPDYLKLRGQLLKEVQTKVIDEKGDN